MSGRRPEVLNFHTVLPERPAEELFFYAHPTVEELEAQVRLLAERYAPLSLQEALEVLRGRRKAPRRGVLVTFDDGFADTALAAEILQRHGVPSVVFLAVDYIGTHRWPWYVALDWMVESSELDIVSWRDRRFALASLGQRKVFRDRFKTLYLRAPAADRQPLLEELARALGVELPEEIPPRRRFLDWDGVRRLPGRGSLLEIGSHGLSHHDLTRLDDAELEREVAASQDRIEAETGDAPRAFSYPDGRHDARVRAAAGRHYEIAFALEDGDGEDPMQQPRRAGLAGGEEALRKVLSPLYGPRQRFWRWRAARGWIR